MAHSQRRKLPDIAATRGDDPRRYEDFCGEVEWFVAGALTLFLIVCHIIRFESAGGLYRDEVNSVHLAVNTPVSENWRMRQFDSFPFGWFLILRAWNALGLAHTDTGWRAFGLIIGLSQVAVAWLTSRYLTAAKIWRPPTALLFLAGFCPASLTTGDSMRAYGLGMLLTLVATVATWTAIRRHAWWRWLGVAATYCIAVQVSFHTAAIVAALTCAASLVGAHRRSVGKILYPLAAGGIAASTLCVYVSMFRSMSTWEDMLKQPLSLNILVYNWMSSLQVIGPSGSQAASSLSEMTPLQVMLVSAVWTLALAALLALNGSTLAGLPPLRLGSRLKNTGAGSDAVRTELLLFVVVGLAVCPASYLAMLYAKGWMTAPKYYLAAISFTAALIDCGLRLGSDSRSRMRLLISSAIAVLGLASCQAVIKGAFTRWTNVDLAGAFINEHAKSGDLVLVAPWEVGVSFSRYCKPGVTWVTVPPLADNTIHRYDLYRQAILSPTFEADVRAAIRRTNHGGGDVWYVGSELAVKTDPTSGQRSLVGSPMSLGMLSCLDGSFREVEQMPPLTQQPVAAHENVSVLVLRR